MAFGTPEGCLLYRVWLWWQLVRQRGVSCTECGFGGVWYARGVSPVPSAALVAVGTPEGCLLYRVWLWWRFGTPEGCLLYRVRLLWRLVHQRGVSCTECGFGGVWYTRGVSPVPSVALVLVCTPEGCLLYRVWLWWRLVHQKGVSCTECGFGGVLVHQRSVSCTECGFGGSWYARGVSPVPSAALVAFGTPEGCLLYRVRLWWQLVHRRGL